MRKNATAARDAGVSLAFFGANDMYWHVRLTSSPLGLDRVVVCYKSATLDPLAASDPGAVTVRWRDAPLNQPEAQLMGEEYGGAAKVEQPADIERWQRRIPEYGSFTDLKAARCQRLVRRRI